MARSTKGGADDALGGGEGLIERREAAFQTAEKMALLMKGGEEGAVAAEQIEVGDEGGGCLFGLEGEMEAQVVALGGVSLPDVALGGEERGAGGVEGAKGVLEGGMIFGLGMLSIA